MDRSASRSREGLSLRTLGSSCALLTILIAPVAVIIASVCNGGVSSRSLVVAVIGGGVCWLAATLALSATFVGNRMGAPVQGVLLGMLARMGLPLAAVIGLPQVSPELAGSGLLTTILGTYLVALVIETLLAVRMIPAAAVKAT